jgi:hypothetical protein
MKQVTKYALEIKMQPDQNVILLIPVNNLELSRRLVTESKFFQTNNQVVKGVTKTDQRERFTKNFCARSSLSTIDGLG